MPSGCGSGRCWQAEPTGRTQRVAPLQKQQLGCQRGPAHGMFDWAAQCSGSSLAPCGRAQAVQATVLVQARGICVIWLCVLGALRLAAVATCRAQQASAGKAK